jgi:hypothetical protein
MLDRWGKSRFRGRIGVLVVSLFLALGAPGVAAQEAAPQPAQAASTPGPAERMSNPGLFEAIGRWLDQGARNFRDQMRGAKARVDDLNDRAAANRKEMNDRAAEMGKGAAEVTIGAMEAVTKLPGTRVMIGRERCTVAPNGAPDCIAAAEALCRKHGFASGKSVDFTSAEECPARALIGGRAADAECRTVTFISRAMCQ